MLVLLNAADLGWAEVRGEERGCGRVAGAAAGQGMGTSRSMTILGLVVGESTLERSTTMT